MAQIHRILPLLTGWSRFSALCGVGFTAGAAVEMFMIKTNFCECASNEPYPLACW